VEIILGAVGALFVAAVVIDIKARRRGKRVRVHGDHNDIYRGSAYLPPGGGDGISGADGGGAGSQ